MQTTFPPESLETTDFHSVHKGFILTLYNFTDAKGDVKTNEKKPNRGVNTVVHLTFMCQHEGLINHNLATGKSGALSNGSAGSRHELKIWGWALGFQIWVKVY